MKKYFAIIGLVLVILVGCISLTGCTNNEEKSANKLVAEAYLIANYGVDDYEIEIAKIKDHTVYFYWNAGEDRYGYSHISMDFIDRNS